MTDREFRRRLIQHKRKRRDRTLKAIIVLLCALVVIYTVALIGVLYLGQGVIV